jgi:putative hydrolase of the HAD superfamily
MRNPAQITTLFVDIGGVLLTNGWDHRSRALAARTFGLDADDFTSRYHLIFDTYEMGKLQLTDDLNRTVYF